MFLLAVLIYGEPFTSDKAITFAFIWGALVVFSFDGSKPKDFIGYTLNMETLRDMHLDKIAKQQYEEDIKKGQKQHTQEVLNTGFSLLTDYQKKYKKIKDCIATVFI